MLGALSAVCLVPGEGASGQAAGGFVKLPLAMEQGAAWLPYAAVSSGDLAGSPAFVSLRTPSETLKLAGTLQTGRYEDGKLDFEGSFSLLTAAKVLHDRTLRVDLASGSVGVRVEASVFAHAELDVVGEVDVEIPDGNGLKLAGSLTGSYTPADGIDFDANLSLRESFVYARDAVAARLKGGGSLGVKIEQSQFKWATLEGVEATVDLVVGQDVLTLDGVVEQGLVERDGLHLLGPFEQGGRLFDVEAHADPERFHVVATGNGQTLVSTVLGRPCP